MQRIAFGSAPESRHYKVSDNPNFSAAYPNAPTFGFRKLSFAPLGLTDCREPGAVIGLYAKKDKIKSDAIVAVNRMGPKMNVLRIGGDKRLR